MTAVASYLIHESSSTANDKFIRNYVRKYEVFMDSLWDTGFEVEKYGTLAGPHPVPGVYTSHVINGRGDPDAYAKNVSCEIASKTSSAGPLWVWHATVNYTTQIDPLQNNPNPLLRPGIDRWSGTNGRIVAKKDRNGKPVINTMGEWFDPGEEIDDPWQILNFTRNEPTYPINALDYQNCVNWTNDFLGFDAGTVKMGLITAEKQVESGYRFYSVTYPFCMRNKGWVRPVMNRGLSYLDDDDVRIFVTPKVVINLDENSSPIVDPDATNFFYLNFEFEDDADFNDLNIVIV